MDLDAYRLILHVGGPTGSWDLSDLDLEADIRRVLHGTPDTAEIRIHNLPPERADALRKGASSALQLSDGQVLFTGYVTEVGAEWQGGTQTHRITVADGWAAWRTATVSAVLPAGSTCYDALAACAEAAGLAMGYVTEAIRDTLFGSPVALHGPVRRVLDDLCRHLGRWTVHDDVLEVLATTDRLSVAALVLDADTPFSERVAISGGKLTAGIRFIPAVRPGQGVRAALTGREIEGRIRSVQHQIAQGGRLWATRIEAEIW